MPRNGAESRGVAAWVRRWWRALLSELVSTALLVLLGVGSLLPRIVGANIQHPPLEHPALAFGFVVLANVQAFGPVSGAHMNPAVTLAALLYGLVTPEIAVAYVVVQAVGAVVGFGALLALAPAAVTHLPAGCTAPAAGVSPWAAAVVEAVLTGVLALVCCGVWAAHDAARPDTSVPIKFGLTIAGLVYAGGYMTGASLNPVRSLAPALFQNYWSHHWVYWVGPLGGAAVCTLLHRFVLQPRPAPPPPPPVEQLPLHDKPEH